MDDLFKTQRISTEDVQKEIELLPVQLCVAKGDVLKVVVYNTFL